MHSPPPLEALLEAAAQVIAREARQQARHRQRPGHHANVAWALAVAALVGVPLVEHLRLRLPPEPMEEPPEEAHGEDPPTSRA
jgi:hypothetical protein